MEWLNSTRHENIMDGIKDECSVLKLQLKERDELIAQLREELEKAQCFQRALASQADKSTQTELVGHDVSSCIKQYFLSSLWVFRLLSAGLPPLLLCPCMDLVILKYLQKHEKIITTICQHTNALLILGFIKS